MWVPVADRQNLTRNDGTRWWLRCSVGRTLRRLHCMLASAREVFNAGETADMMNWNEWGKATGAAYEKRSGNMWTFVWQ